MDDTRTVRAGRRTVALHRPRKVLFPAGGGGEADGGKGGRAPGDADGRPGVPTHGHTKEDLFDYYRAVAPYMLPHLRGRPLLLERHPDGVGGPRFLQKETPDHYPGWVTRAEVAKEDGTVTHTVCDDTATLLFLADQACVTLHRWLSRSRRVDHPDRMVFDLDPAQDDPPQDGLARDDAARDDPGRDRFDVVRDAARLLGELLDHMGLPSAPMTTGSRGLHVVVPLDGRHAFDDVRDFAGEVADTLADAHPERFTTADGEAARGGRLHLGVRRNGYARTAVAPFSVRSAPGAPVAVPIAWRQVDDPAVHARRWTIDNAVEQARTNPWADVLRSGRALGPARHKLRALRG